MNRISEFVTETWRGKSIGRILLNWKIREAAHALHGKGLDVAGGKGSYYRFLPPLLSIVRTNLSGEGLDRTVDLNMPLPFADGEFDFVLFFNAIYILDNPVATLRELRRIVRKGGVLLMSSPFLAAEIPEPHDYLRFTAEGLDRLFRESGWESWKTERVGDRFVGASYLAGAVMPRGVRLPLYALAMLFDAAMPPSFRERYPVPVSYLCTATK